MFSLSDSFTTRQDPFAITFAICDVVQASCVRCLTGSLARSRLFSGDLVFLALGNNKCVPVLSVAQAGGLGYNLPICSVNSPVKPVGPHADISVL